MVLSSGLQGPSRVSGCFLLCNAFLFFAIELSVYLRGPPVAYVWVVHWHVLFMVFKCVFCLVLISCTITFHCSLFA